MSAEDYLPEPPDEFVALTPPPNDGAPHPLEGGFPEYGYGDGGYDPGGDDAEALPSVLDAEEMRKVDPAEIEACAKLDQNDTGNGKRLFLHLEHELFNVREIEWHRYAGRINALPGSLTGNRKSPALNKEI